jgi:HEPN domain-containing protein
MTPHDSMRSEDPREWLRRARSNLTLAQSDVAGVDPEDLCFESQQAAEKSIKAVMITRSIDFPYTHSLPRLLTLLEEAGEYIPPDVRQAERLTRYAFETRYPGPTEPVTEEITNARLRSRRRL